jgi:hypothetical protein
MSGNDQFDPARSAAIRQMLVANAAHDLERRRGFSGHIALFVGLIIAALAIGGGSTAWALGVRPFASAPVVASPTATPTPRPTPVANLAPPKSSMPFDCAALAAPSLSHFIATPRLTHSFSDEDPALRDAGVLSCVWTGADGASTVNIEVAADVAAGKADIAGLLAHGDRSLNVGDVSAVSCPPDDGPAACTASVVAGNYWFELVGASYLHTQEAPALAGVTALAKYVSGVVGAGASSEPSWVMPPSSWATVSDCSSLATATPMSAILDSPGIVGPKTQNDTTGSPIEQTQTMRVTCTWNVGSTVKPDPYIDLQVNILPGAYWAYQAEAHKVGAAQVVVKGATNAVMHCYPVQNNATGKACELFVLTDDSYMAVSAETNYRGNPNAQSKLVAAAEAILAAHTRAS